MDAQMDAQTDTKMDTKMDTQNEMKNKLFFHILSTFIFSFCLTNTMQKPLLPPLGLEELHLSTKALTMESVSPWLVSYFEL
jgi:hypothetical protein